MTNRPKTKLWRSEDGRAWHIGTKSEIAWIKENTPGGLAITSAIPPIFDAYATLVLPGETGAAVITSPSDEECDRHKAAVLSVLSEHAAPQPWWLGYLETGAWDLPFGDARRTRFYAGWSYVLVEAGPEQANAWPADEWKCELPDLMFPADRSWLFSTLWDDEWSCIGGSRGLVDAFLNHPDLAQRVREVDPSMEDATPPGHTAY